MCQPISLLIELAVGQRTPLEGYRHRVRGARSTCAEKSAGTETGVAGWANVARLLHSSRWACSASLTRSMDNNRRVGLVVMINSLDQWSWPPTPAGNRSIQCVDAGRVEYVGVIFDAEEQFVRLGEACIVSG